MRLTTLLLSVLLAVPLFGQRLQVPINDGWDFLKWDMAQFASEGPPPWQRVSIPHTWNDKDAQSGLSMYQGFGWYRRALDIKPEWQGQRVFLRFEGVGAVADVYVNDKHVGQHKGAYSAFCFDVTQALKFDGPNEIRVRADNRAKPDVIPVNHHLFAVFGGIYRPVTMIVTPPVHITPLDYASPGIYIKQNKVDKSEASIEVTAKLANISKTLSDLALLFEVRDFAGKAVATANTKIRMRPSGGQTFRQTMTLAKPRLWNGKKDPYLYSVTVSIKDGEKILDSVTQPLGLRTYTFDEKRGFILNGEPYPLRGVCRHQEREDKGSALTNADHQEDLDMMMEIGASSLRLAHYQQSEYI
ncbi:MAG: hypothetical protein LBC63_07715, partial [Holophagales bacterium]|nr:hypothetical protein [Holophagales bacterium]